MKRNTLPLAAILLLAAALPACATKPLQTYSWTNPAEAIDILARRGGSIHSVRATCAIVLEAPNGDRVSFDGAIVARKSTTPPALIHPEDPATNSASNAIPSLHLRTWKFGQAAMDLVARPDGVWLAVPESMSEKHAQQAASFKPEHIAEAWSLFLGDYFYAPKLTLTNPERPTFQVRRTLDSGEAIECDVDRATLTPRQYRIIDASGVLRQTLTLSLYRTIDDTPWPMRLEAKGEEGRIEVRFDDVEINPELDDAAFTPPKRAVKQTAPQPVAPQ